MVALHKEGGRLRAEGECMYVPARTHSKEMNYVHVADNFKLSPNKMSFEFVCAARTLPQRLFTAIVQFTTLLCVVRMWRVGTINQRQSLAV